MERTHTSGKAFALVVWPKLGSPCVETKNAADKHARWMQRDRERAAYDLRAGGWVAPF